MSTKPGCAGRFATRIPRQLRKRQREQPARSMGVLFVAVRNRHCASRLLTNGRSKYMFLHGRRSFRFGAMTLSGSDIYLTRRTWFLMTATGVREHRWYSELQRWLLVDTMTTAGVVTLGCARRSAAGREWVAVYLPTWHCMKRLGVQPGASRVPPMVLVFCVALILARAATAHSPTVRFTPRPRAEQARARGDCRPPLRPQRPRRLPRIPTSRAAAGSGVADSFTSSTPAGAGAWAAAARRQRYSSRLRDDWYLRWHANAGIAWMDTRLLSARLYSAPRAQAAVRTSSLLRSKPPRPRRWLPPSTVGSR